MSTEVGHIVWVNGPVVRARGSRRVGMLEVVEVGQGGFVHHTAEPSALEEAFTGTFDVNPACALEVGWHLFGEEYARGMFLVRMREELRKYGLAESSELPDHVSHVLAIVNAIRVVRIGTLRSYVRNNIVAQACAVKRSRSR